MEVGMSLNALVRLPLSSSSRTQEDGLVKHSFFSPQRCRENRRSSSLLVVEAKGKRGMANRQFQQRPPPLPKIEDDGNPKFVIFIRMANVYIWYPLSLITGGTTAKIMVAAKDNFLGKYIYKDTLARNIAAVIYRENGNVRAGLATNDVIELPTPDKLKTVVDKVKDFFGDAKESFGKLTTLNSTEGEEPRPEVTKGEEKAKIKG
ncbi:unnamed protein product [Linum tenue]|uniref:Protein HHL1, chloroplastic n=1 Tax=Linum tenue TaxID=586396 RepID=A0AAV0KVS0_9ROSI|nr:unnamed protein product [Linum tenue]CAI0426061.1 unnamed protein product [Linum tenue]